MRTTRDVGRWSHHASVLVTCRAQRISRARIIVGAALLVGVAACGSTTDANRTEDPTVATLSLTTHTLGPPPTTTARGLGIADIPREVHAYYYAWYGNPKVDGYYDHWTHPRQLANGTEGPKRVAPDDAGIADWPAVGLYSSKDPAVVDNHFREMHDAAIDVAIVSWWGPGSGADALLPLIFDKAALHDVKVTVVMEPNWNSVDEFVSRIHYLIDTYGKKPAFYRNKTSGNRPLFYTYDPLWRHREQEPRPSQQQWRDVFTIGGARTLRGTPYDSIVIAQVENQDDIGVAARDGLDGITTYLANFDFSSFPGLARVAANYDMAFVPSVGPGYDDSRIRPWNNPGIRQRNNGTYYKTMVSVATREHPRIIAVTSFNEWHEGTQIEPAVDHPGADGYTFPGYGPLGEDGYLKLTREWALAFKATK